MSDTRTAEELEQAADALRASLLAPSLHEYDLRAKAARVRRAEIATLRKEAK